MSRYFDFLIHVGARRQDSGALRGDYYPVEAHGRMLSKAIQGE